MSSNMNSTKKRRVDEGGGGGEQSSNGGGLVHEELKSISSHMTSMMQTLNQLVDSNRTQMAMMSSMQGEITRLTEKCDEIKGLKGEIIRLTEKCNIMDKMSVARFDRMDDKQNTISENMNSRFEDVDNKQKYHQVLLKNQQWKYSASRPPNGYWDGLDEDEDVAAEEFLQQIKKYTEEMRYGTSNGDIRIHSHLRYGEVFLPHWKEFADALKQYRYCIKCLPEDNCDANFCLVGMELSDTVLDLLSNSLESTHFNRFVLGNNNLGQRGIEFALKYLQSNQIIKEFSLFDNAIDNMTDIKQICQTVEENPSIEVLALSGCCGEELDGYEMLQLIMPAGKSKLKLVNLSGNDIGTDGGTFISDFLTGNPMLEALDLSGNQLDDNDAIAIATALKYNTKLRALDLTDNNISKNGWEALRKAEFDDTSLNSAADSNHTCTIKYPSGVDEIQGLDTAEMNGNSDYWFSAQHVRRKKVYSVLSSRNRRCSNVGYFDDVPVELLPDMLNSIHQYSEYHLEHSEMSQDTNDVNPLSLVFEVCRYWDKSIAVYELLSS